MLLPQTKEREYRFKLALRMGLPIFALIIALVSHTLIDNYATLNTSFYIESLILLVFGIYFILYLIYNGFNVKITDDVTKTFTREYLFNYIEEELKKEGDYTLILISIDNLNDINRLYGLKNGDRVLRSVGEWIGTYLQEKQQENFPLGHLKGGDFIIGLRGNAKEFTTLLELMCLKSNEFNIDDIEVKISASISDTNYSKELDYIIENLFEIQEQRRNSRSVTKEETLSPSELEASVINAINNRRLNIMTQDVYSSDSVAFKECFIKLLDENSKLLYTKSYMKILNRLGLSVEYDLMVLEELILKTKEREEIYALNISPSSLRNEKFLHRSKELLKETSIKVMFVLSELEYFSHTSRYNSILNSLKHTGVLIAIDRVGSIHSSFLYLRELDIDVIRFGTYYSNFERLESNLSIIKGFKIMAEEKGIKTWIKNIENSETLELVTELKIDYTQGKELSSLKPVYEKK
jgi:EAL domain-containing protein (putative c-di-GMP-specific phosphodiesterase class I)/GGDEF domain-containing protein